MDFDIIGDKLLVHLSIYHIRTGAQLYVVNEWMVSVGSTSAFVGTCLRAEMVMRFPVPFMLQLGSVVMGLYIAVMVRRIFSKKEFGATRLARPNSIDATVFFSRSWCLVEFTHSTG